jgi:pimeloyl-ACP methyl ester carboxylesterase
MLARGENPLIVDTRDEFDLLMELVFEEKPPMPWPVGVVLERRFAERAWFHEKMWDDIWGRAEEVTGLLPDIRVPTLVVWGDADRILDPSSLEVFARWLPRAEFEVMMHTGHSPMIERPSRSATIYVDFLRRSGQGSGGSGDGRSGP